MATPLPCLSPPALSPLWRNSLRTWLAATLTIGIMVWSGRAGVMLLGLLVLVVFINNDEVMPLRSSAQLVGGSLIGIVTSGVLHAITGGWLVTALALLITGALVRQLSLIKGLSMGYLSCWAVEIMGAGRHFDRALIVDLALSVLVGIATAQLATWTFWPRRPLQQLPALERDLCLQLSQQIRLIRQWLTHGGSPPAPLASQTLLPSILVLQQLRPPGHDSGRPPGWTLTARWAQTGDIWRQLLRQWMLLEPLLLELPAPLDAGALLQQSLRSLESSLQGGDRQVAAARLGAIQEWLAEASRLQAPAPLLLAIALQLDQLQHLLFSRCLLRQSIAQRLGGSV